VGFFFIYAGNFLLPNIKVQGVCLGEAFTYLVDPFGEIPWLNGNQFSWTAMFTMAFKRNSECGNVHSHLCTEFCMSSLLFWPPIKNINYILTQLVYMGVKPVLSFGAYNTLG
jgi:hypothetical protein